jgi:hypothetical protein
MRPVPNEADALAEDLLAERLIVQTRTASLPLSAAGAAAGWQAPTFLLTCPLPARWHLEMRSWSPGKMRRARARTYATPSTYQGSGVQHIQRVAHNAWTGGSDSCHRVLAALSSHRIVHRATTEYRRFAKSN